MASAATSLPARLHGPDSVDVAYEPWRALRRTALRIGPDARAPHVFADGGEPVVLDAGSHYGRQTTRNPRCLDRPPLRPAIGGFVWGYCMPPAVRKSGWMALADLARDRACPKLACGPAGADFDRRRPQACGGHCDGQPLTGVQPASGPAVVEVRDLYLRYAPRSTAFRYLVDDDRVRLLARWHTAPGWFGVEVVRARWASLGERGWVLGSGLAIPGD